MLITISGLDGAGKSTLIGLLKSGLERRDMRVSVSHMYRDVGAFAFGKVMLEKFTRADDAGGLKRGFGRGAVNIFARSLVWNQSLRMLVYPLDLLIFVFYRLYVEGVKRHVLIMDRYFYDTLVDLSAGRRSRAARFLSRLTPTPCVPILLDINPGEAFARKGEHTIPSLERRREAYKNVFPNGGRGLVLEAGEDIADNLLAVESAVLKRMDGR